MPTGGALQIYYEAVVQTHKKLPFCSIARVIYQQRYSTDLVLTRKMILNKTG